MQWSAPKTGWLERNWIKAGIPYERIDSILNRMGMNNKNTKELVLGRPRRKPPYTNTIDKGLVLDIGKRTSHCFSQINQLVNLATAGNITNDDVIYFDDFWHLGIEALPYAFHQLKISPKMYAFCHAQSVDEFDFTYPMKHWMRDFEKGIGTILSGIFVNSDMLKNLLVEAGIGTEQSVHVIGHIFCEEEVQERFPKKLPLRENTVVFSSRWDDEKKPRFFLDVVKEVMKYRQDIKFVICTSQKKLRSNNPNNLLFLQHAMKEFPNNLFLKEGLSKEEYYLELLKAKIQINTADQDWVSIALLEASTAGCYPVYPNIRSFPQAFKYDNDYIYLPLTPTAAANKIEDIIEYSYLWGKDKIESRAWIHRRHNTSWARMINIMMKKDVEENIVEVEPYE